MLKKLSVIVPVFNEEFTIGEILRKLFDVKLPNAVAIEVIVVNDYSNDKTEEVIETFILNNPQLPVKYLKHPRNLGKGAAIKTGIKGATGEYIIIQDADLEYDPYEFPLLIDPVRTHGADVVFGSRFLGGSPRRVLFFWHMVGNKFLTLLTNIVTDLNLTDMETCYKVIRRDLLLGINLRENRFGFEPEVTIKLAKIKGVKIYEVGISYAGRTYAEGKKINWKDGVRAIYCIIKYSIFYK
jgi:glycosyltransferase involved in cell wall biosynthesis